MCPLPNAASLKLRDVSGTVRFLQSNAKQRLDRFEAIAPGAFFVGASKKGPGHAVETLLIRMFPGEYMPGAMRFELQSAGHHAWTFAFKVPQP